MKNMKWTTPAVLLLALAISACGGKNESGKKGNVGHWNGLGAGSYQGVQPLINNPLVNAVLQQLPCSTGAGIGNQRMGGGVLLQGPSSQIALNSSYLGVSVEGDIAIVTRAGTGQAVLSLYLCPRPGISGAQVYQNPIVNRTIRGCLVDEISALNVHIAQHLPPIAFFPGHFHPQVRQILQCMY
jgi:hypothetical protein